MPKRKEIYYRGLIVSASIIYAGWEGDPSVPGGVNHLPPYCEDIEVHSTDGDDITDMLTDKAIEECGDALLEDDEDE